MALRDSPSAAAVWRAACEKFCAGVVGGKIHRYLPPAWLADERAAHWMRRRTRFMSAAAITYARECSEQAQSAAEHRRQRLQTPEAELSAVESLSHASSDMIKLRCVMYWQKFSRRFHERKARAHPLQYKRVLEYSSRYGIR